MGNNKDFWEGLEEEMGNTSTQKGNISYLEDGNEEELRTVFVYLVYDVSGSMGAYPQTMFNSCVQTCRALSSAENEDYKFRVKVVNFNTEVKEYNSAFQAPDELAAVIREDFFACNGQTKISEIIKYLDGQFSRDKLKDRKLHKSDPKSLVVIVTDYCATETAETVADATSHILSNRFYNKANKTLCIFCGEDKYKASAAELAGGLDNVVSMGQEYIKELLTDVLITSTITLSDATHVEGTSTATKTTSEVTKEIIDNRKNAGKSAEQMSDEEAKEALIQLLS